MTGPLLIGFPQRTGLHNFAYPRTDAVVIMIAIDQSRDRVLLGRNVRFTLAQKIKY